MLRRAVVCLEDKLKMETVLENLVSMVKKNPEGIPLKKLAVVYSQMYHKNLTLSSLGFDSMTSLVSSLHDHLVLDGELVFHKDQWRKQKTKARAKARAEVEAGASADRGRSEVVLEDIVTMMKDHPAGIPLKKLSILYSQTYHKNLTLSSLGFDSMTSLVSSLHDHLVLDGELVFHKHQWRKQKTKARAKAKAEVNAGASDDRERSEAVLEDIVTMMKDHPAGIPLKKLSILYGQTYHKNLMLSSLGYKSMLCLLEALSEDLILIGDIVFHRIHQNQSQNQPVDLRTSKPLGDSRPQTPHSSDGLNSAPREDPSSAPSMQTALSFLGPPLISTFPLPSSQNPLLSQNPPVNPLMTTSRPAEALSKSQLYNRVLQVMRSYKLLAPSMDQLKAAYLQMFGELLPINQYMSMYDSWEASCPKTPPLKPAPGQSKGVWNTPAAPAASSLPSSSSDFPVLSKDASSPLSSSDFPALGTEATREKKSRGREASPREGSASAAPVFKEAYHAQLREIHGGNMRAVETLENDEELTGWKRKKVMDQESVNILMEEVMREIAAEGELVTREKAISRVCQLLQIPSLDAGRINPWNIPALRDLQYIMREINMFIECTETVTSICTLYELGQSLAGLKDKKHYEELNLGPLCKLPLVHRMFKIDSNTKDDDIRQIQTIDILKQLRVFRRQVSKPKVDLAEFMKYLADHYNCDSPYELGIRIHSIGLPIATLIKVSRAEHQTLEQARDVIQKELMEETEDRLRKVKRSVLDPLQGAASSTGNSELRRKYASMTAAEVVLAIYSNAEGVFNPRMTKHVQSFLLQVSGNPLAKALFQLAICGGSLAVPQDLVPKEKKTSEQSKAEDGPQVSLPSEGKVKQFLKDSLSSQNSAVTLAHIAALEKKLTKHFQVKDFVSLKHGNFLEFLVKNLQLLQDCLGSSLILSSCSMELSGSGFRPSRQDVFEFINQCGDISSTDPEELSHIESALRTHFKVRDSRDLGFGTLHMLAGLVQRQRSLGGGGQSLVHYESALFARQGKQSVEMGGEAVGRLGEVSKDQALSCLHCCPLLEDLNQWSQWELVFKPHHGPLKDFIERNAGNSGLLALEVTPGLLLRITSHTGDKHFSAAVMNLDPVGTAGHLVSMVIADGIANAPTALLANHMQRSLDIAVAREEMSQDEEDILCYRRVAKFLLECFIRIPSRISQALLNKVFLEPFSGVLGQTKSKLVLITVAQSDPRHLNCLHRLGILLGVTEWMKDFQKKLNAPQNHGDMHTAAEEHAKSNLMDSESSSLSALNTSEDEFMDENVMDTSSVSSGLDQNHQPVLNGIEHDEEEEDEDEEELYELTSVPNGETSAVSSDADGRQKEDDSGTSDSEESESEDDQSETAIDIHRAIIEDIRKSEFGIGVELNAEGQKLMQVSQERLGRSLDRLSTELYSKDTHFVLELIQNADDNSYLSEDSVVPALAFVVERDCITVLNNETGFQEKNIRAICDVGRSTKGKHKYGYIGQKGIGFKSVFKVTDCPEIHSNGFHLRFDKTCGPMGYILPHWADDERMLDAQLKELNLQSWTTKICLPLRPDNHQTRNLFHDVHPSLLLFLHRLRSITIYNRSEKRLVKMTRKDLSDSVLEVQHTEGVQRWLVVKSTVQPKKIKEDIESTELALAFELRSNSTGSDIIFQPQKQPVFAYLPLRSFGFRFIIQGDFDIPSSREDVDRDSSWNQWLRSEIPQLFLQAMDVFTDHPEFRGLKGLCQFLQFIPLPDEVLDFFKPVAGQIIQLLKGKAFLPTLSSDGQVVYKLPSQVAVCQDAVIRDVIGGEELERHLSLSYLHPELSRAAPTSLLTHLGVRYLRGSDVTTVTTAMAKELMRVEGIHSEGGLHQLASLLVCNFRALEHGYGEAESILQTLRDLPIIPLADGRVVALNGEGVFFPMEETKTKKKNAQADSGPLSALYKDVSVVHPSLLTCVDPLQSQQVRELLRRLGVHDLEPQQLLQQHIYPILQSNKWKTKHPNVVVSYLVFIKQHASSQEYADTAVPVLTNKGRLVCPSDDRVHFSEEYGNIDLPETLPGCDWLLLSSCYVQTDGDVAGWRDLFTRLGVRDGLIIRRQRQTLSAKDLACSPWAAESSGWSRSAGEEYVIDDYPCEEFEALASAQLSNPLLLQQRMALLQLLNNNWDTGQHYSQYLTAQVINHDGHPIKNTRSSFFHLLCTLEWIPAYQPMEGGNKDRKYLCPNSVYLTSPEISSLLGSHVCYVDLEPGEFSRALGMRHSINVDVLIKYLKEWCTKPDDEEQTAADEESEGRSFTSTFQHIHNVYSYLNNNCPPGSLKELFTHTPAVFIEYNRRNDGWCSGRFYHLKEVCWSDPTTMFQRYKQLTHGADSPVQQPKVLAPFYSPLEGMKAFFIRQLNVDLSPNMNQYIGLLELVCSSCSCPNTEVLQDISVLYAKLARICTIPVSGDQENMALPSLNQAYCSTLKGMVSDKRVFPTKENTWVTLARRPMIADNKELEKVFKSHREVCLLNLPPAEKKSAPRRTGQGADRGHGEAAFSEKDRSLFLEICGIKRFSDCVKSEPVTEHFRPCPTMQAMVRSVVPYIQKFLFHHDELADVYTELTENNIAERIRKLRFSQVGKLYIRYQLDIPEGEELVELQDVDCLLKDQKELCIQKDHLSAKLEVCRELVKLFCTETTHRKELMRFLSGLITSINDQDPRSLQRFLQREDIRELPADEEPWEVPEPSRPEVNLERVPSRGKTPTEVPARPAHEDGEETLVCWPPRASIQNTGSNRTASADGAGVVDAVMKMWPPPAGPKDRDPERDTAAQGSHNFPRPSSHEGHQPIRTSQEGNQLSRTSQEGTQPIRTSQEGNQPSQEGNKTIRTSQEGNQLIRSSILSDQSQKVFIHPPSPSAVSANAPQAPDMDQQSRSEGAKGGQELLTGLSPAQAPPPPAPPVETAASETPAVNIHSAPEAMLHPSMFQGASASVDRPPLNLDFPVLSSQMVLEDMELHCQRPSTVVLSEDHRDLTTIGEWGEQLVNSFLCHWRDSGNPGSPAHVLWCNQNGESGQPYDFKLTFSSTGTPGVVYVEVKSTIKKERSFIHLSANELDFALKERERYHVFRVYSAGDSNNVRLCRIQNLAQHLHTKELNLYLFV
ncbi:protein NO VEIN isoform X2 [Cheilinus undulatus]|uniref:protein NO VEIN isoform X2 n=1 Tax=Cheilinus undulatus TaxID=241271 RepID=UPI001BD3B292|nr:protein NO VEIN isoform X2 [Cheilinus undulatus]